VFRPGKERRILTQRDVQGPFKKFEYKANEKKEIGMIAGGSGVTPMYQVALHALDARWRLTCQPATLADYLLDCLLLPRAAVPP
jgi:NAD(P)H-flavin reductase